MKKFLALSFLLIGMLAFAPPGQQVLAAPQGVCFVMPDLAVVTFASIQEDGGSTPVVVENISETPGTNFFLENWGALLLGLLAFIELIVRLTPSEKDNSIFNWIWTLVNALLPNLKKGGGTFTVSSK